MKISGLYKYLFAEGELKVKHCLYSFVPGLLCILQSIAEYLIAFKIF